MAAPAINYAVDRLLPVAGRADGRMHSAINWFARRRIFLLTKTGAPPSLSLLPTCLLICMSIQILKLHRVPSDAVVSIVR